jgi:hypothetical protein
VRIRFSAPDQTRPGTHPDSYTMGIGSIPGVKRPGHGVKHPPLSSAEATLPLCLVAGYRVHFNFTLCSRNVLTTAFFFFRCISSSLHCSGGTTATLDDRDISIYWYFYVPCIRRSSFRHF